MTQAEELKLYKFKFESMIESHSRLAFEKYDLAKRVQVLEEERRVLCEKLHANKRWWNFWRK